MRRYSIRTLITFVFLTAVGLAALRNANELWAGMMLLTALTAVGVAVLGAAIMPGQERCWWLGFAVFSGGYLGLTFVPVVSAEIGPRLVTTTTLGFAHSQVTSREPLPQVLWRQHAQVATRDRSPQGGEPRAGRSGIRFRDGNARQPGGPATRRGESGGVHSRRTHPLRPTSGPGRRDDRGLVLCET